VGTEGLTTTIPLFFMTLSVTLAGLLLSSNETLIIGIVLSITILILPFSPTSNATQVSFSQSFAASLFVLTTTAITVLVGRFREQNLHQLEQQQTELTASLAETDAARKQAERSDKVKSAFLASMSHELRTPLNAIINFTEFVAAGDTGPVNDEQKELLDEVIGSGKHLLNLINDVLDMSKIEAGSLNLFIEDNIDLKAILENGLSTCRRLVKDGVELHSTIAPDLPSVRGDRQRLLQVLLNILSNACKFTDQGEIKLNAVVNKGEIVVSVTDTGPGIAPADQAAVFEAFKQTTVGLRQGRGTGLGMPIARSLVEAHGGRLWLESTPGTGSTFYFALPVASTILKPTL
jgi:signal transduction histidine kinase